MKKWIVHSFLFLMFSITISSCGNSPTSPAPTPTPGPANTNTPTATSTFTACMNSSQTPCTYTPTFTATNTFTPTPTSTKTNTPTFTPTGSYTATPTGSVTSTPTSTVTSCPWTPSVPFTVTPSLTPYPAPTGNFFYGYAIHDIQISAGVTQDVSFGDVYLTVNNAAVNNAAVTFSGPFSSAPASFLTNISLNGITYGFYLTSSPLTVLAGQSYTLTVTTVAGTSSATGTAPGNITQAADGTSTSWTNAGNYDEVEVVDGFGYKTFLTGPAPPALSPISVPPGAYPHCGAYTMYTSVSNLVTPTNAAAGSQMYIMDNYINSTIDK